MGAWGTGAFDNDTACDLLPNHVSNRTCFQAQRRLPMRVLLVATGACWLSACAASRVASSHAAAELAWDSGCYDDISYVATELTGPDFVDCGLWQAQASRTARAQFHRCVKSVSSSGTPFRLGRASILPDASRCTVAIRSEEGQLWEVYYDFDYDHGASATGDGIAFRWFLQLSRCESLDLVSAASGDFQFTGCIEDRSMTERMLDARQERLHHD